MIRPIATCLMLLAATGVHAQSTARPSSAKPSPAKVSAAKPAGEKACGCEQIETLKQEIRNAITLRDRHKAKAADLRARYPGRLTSQEARRDYQAFETGSGPGAAAEGITATGSGAVQAISYVPRGARLREMHAMDETKGIGRADKRATVDGYDRDVPDLEARRRIEAEWKAKGQDLCEFENAAAVAQAASASSSCAGIARATAAHEASHKATCQRVGFYQFHEGRDPAQMADDEVAAYQGQIALLATELKTVLSDPKKTKLENPPGLGDGSVESLLAAKARCVVAVAIKGKIDDLVLDGKSCDIAEPFAIATRPNANFKLKPNDEAGGTYAYDGNVGPFRFFGSGGYTLDLDSGKLVLDGSGRWFASAPRLGTSSKGGPETLRVSRLESGC